MRSREPAVKLKSLSPVAACRADGCSGDPAHRMRREANEALPCGSVA